MPFEVTRREALQTAMMATQATARALARPPNILSSDLRRSGRRGPGCAGNKAIHTPNLDRMAAEGMRFTDSFATSPLCSPNRSAIFTSCVGHLTSTSRLHAPLPDWETSFVDLLKNAGYHAGAYRKVDQGPSFDRRWNYIMRQAGSLRSTTSSRQAPTGKPFFLHVGFNDPHRPYRPGAFSPPHDPAKVEVPAYLPDCEESRKDSRCTMTPSRAWTRNAAPSLEILRRPIWKRIRSSCSPAITANRSPVARAPATIPDCAARWSRAGRDGSSREPCRTNSFHTWTCR